MTKGELEKEVEEKAKIYFNNLGVDDGNVSDTRFSDYDVYVAYKRGSLDFAEPRERRIFELKNKLSHAKEVIRRLLEEERNNTFWVMNGADRSSFFQAVKQAEQFLMEVL